MFGQLFKNRRIVLCRDEYRHITMVFGSCSDHRRTANINILDGVCQCAVSARYRGFEGVEIDDNQINGRDVVRCHDTIIDPSATQNAAMNFWM